MLLISSCNKIENRYFTEAHFELVDSTFIELPVKHSFGTYIQHYERNDTNFLMLNSVNEKQLIEIDIDHNTVSRIIPVNFISEDVYPIFLFHYHNFDSILILRDVNNLEKLEHDSILALIDFKGNPFSYINLRGGDFLFSGDYYSDSSKGYFSHELSNFNIFENRLFITPVSAFYYDIRLAEMHGFRPLGYVDFLNKNHDFIEIPLEHQLSREGLFAIEQKRGLNTRAISKNLIVVSLPANRSLIITDTLGNITREPENKYHLISNPVELEYLENGAETQINTNSSVFGNIIIDHSNEYIIRFSSLPAPKGLNETMISNFRNRHQWFGVYDFNLNLIAEGMIPQGLSTKLPIPGHFDSLFVVATASINEPYTLKVKYFRLKFKKASENRIDELKKVEITNEPVKSLDHFFRKSNLPEGSIILLVPSHSCPYCVNNAVQYFTENIEKMKNDNVYLYAEREIGENYLSFQTELNLNNVFIEKNSELRDYYSKKMSNPIILFWNGQSIEFEMLLTPESVDNIGDFIDEMIGYR